MKLNKIKYKDIEQIPHRQVAKKFSQDFFGSAPAPFIGRFGYPNVNIGVLSPQFSGDTDYYHSPKLWAKSQFSIGQVATLRSALMNSRSKGNVKDLSVNKRFLEICQEVGVAKRSVELEVKLQRKPSLNTKPDKEIIPFGPAAKMRHARITENPTTDTRVERVISDTDLKAARGILSLYKKGFEDVKLSKILSVGNLGIGKNRKLVPTRWSITAVDDTVGKESIKKVKEYSSGEIKAYFGCSWGNYYLFLFFDDVWSYELFETYLKKPVNPWSKKGYAYSTDYENYKGRKEYAQETAGGYYAARLPILEEMMRTKRQGSCLALRFITDEYNVPLGVWVCREAARKAIGAKPVHFATHELMMSYASELIKQKFGFDITSHLQESKLLQEQKQQMKLSAWSGNVC